MLKNNFFPSIQVSVFRFFSITLYVFHNLLFETPAGISSQIEQFGKLVQGDFISSTVHNIGHVESFVDGKTYTMKECVGCNRFCISTFSTFSCKRFRSFREFDITTLSAFITFTPL